MSEEVKAPRKEDIRISKQPVDFSSLSVFVDGKPIARVQSIQFRSVNADQRHIVAEFSVLADEEPTGSIFATPVSKPRSFEAYLTSWRNNVLRFTTEPASGAAEPPIDAPDAAPEAKEEEDEPGF